MTVSDRVMRAAELRMWMAELDRPDGRKPAYSASQREELARVAWLAARGTPVPETLDVTAWWTVICEPALRGDDSGGSDSRNAGDAVRKAAKSMAAGASEPAARNAIPAGFVACEGCNSQVLAGRPCLCCAAAAQAREARAKRAAPRWKADIIVVDDPTSPTAHDRKATLREWYHKAVIDRVNVRIHVDTRRPAADRVLRCMLSSPAGERWLGAERWARLRALAAEHRPDGREAARDVAPRLLALCAELDGAAGWRWLETSEQREWTVAVAVLRAAVAQ